MIISSQHEPAPALTVNTEIPYSMINDIVEWCIEYCQTKRGASNLVIEVQKGFL